MTDGFEATCPAELQTLSSSPNPHTIAEVSHLVPGEPAWAVALLYPPQGSWTEADYLELDAGRLVEFSEGCVEVLDMPTKQHQRIVRFLFQLLNQFVSAADLGEVFFAPLPVRLWTEKFREPDLVFVRHGRSDYRGYPDGADLVVEVVSEGEANRRRDLEIKPDEYCRAGIDEYWIVDPQSATISVLVRSGQTYQPRVYQSADTASSDTLAGFSVSVEQVFAGAETSN